MSRYSSSPLSLAEEQVVWSWWGHCRGVCTVFHLYFNLQISSKEQVLKSGENSCPAIAPQFDGLHFYETITLSRKAWISIEFVRRSNLVRTGTAHLDALATSPPHQWLGRIVLYTSAKERFPRSCLTAYIAAWNWALLLHISRGYVYDRKTYSKLDIKGSEKIVWYTNQSNFRLNLLVEFTQVSHLVIFELSMYSSLYPPLGEAKLKLSFPLWCIVHWLLDNQVFNVPFSTGNMSKGSTDPRRYDSRFMRCASIWSQGFFVSSNCSVYVIYDVRLCFHTMSVLNRQSGKKFRGLSCRLRVRVAK